MRGITSLEIDLPDARHFLPAFDEYFGHLAQTLRSLILVCSRDPVETILHFVPRFPLLQNLDLTAARFAGRRPCQSFTPPDITTSPPLDGILWLRIAYPTISFLQSTVNITGGIHFRSVEMAKVRKAPLQVILDACSNTLESITFGSGIREYLYSALFLAPELTLAQAKAKPDLRKCTVLKRLRIALSDETSTYEELEVYLSGVLATIVSPSFSTFIVKLSEPRAHSSVWIQSRKTAFDDLATRGANTGMVFRVKPIDPLDHFLPAGPGCLLSLKPCHWDAG